MELLATDHLRLHTCESALEAAERAAAFICAVARESVARTGRFQIVLAGGQSFRATYEIVARRAEEWPSWCVFQGDERCAPRDSDVRNSHMLEAVFLSRATIPRERVFMIPSELGAAQAALAYDRLLQTVDTFDLVLLGLGEDGHIASLFPPEAEVPSLDGAGCVQAVHGAPKAPSERVSMTLGRLCRTRRMALVVTGAAKHGALEAWQSGKPVVASRLRAQFGIDIFVDNEARTGCPPGAD